MLGAIESNICSYMCSYKACSFFVVPSLALNVLDSVDALLQCRFRVLRFVFSLLILLLARVVTSLFVITSFWTALKKSCSSNVRGG